MNKKRFARRLLGDLLDSPFHQLALWAMSAGRAQEVPVHTTWISTNAGQLFEFAGRNGIESILGHALLDADLLTAEDSAMWQSAHDAWQHRLDVYLGILDETAGRLAQAGIRLVALKNAGIARGIYPCRGCCPMGDVDVLVGRSSFVEAHRLLLDMGFELDSRSTVETAHLEEGLKGGGNEYRLEREGEVLWFELQWRPVAGRWLRPDQEPDGEDLVGRSVPIDGTDVRLLAPEDNLVQVALHTAKHSYVRAPGLRLHTDVDRIVSYQSVDWDRFLSVVRELEIMTPVYFSLAIPKELLGTAVPEEVMAELRPPSVKDRVVVDWLRRVGLFEPDERKFSRLEMLAFHTMLYEDFLGVVASVAGTGKEGLRRLGPIGLVLAAKRRLSDVLTRYDR